MAKQLRRHVYNYSGDITHNLISWAYAIIDKNKSHHFSIQFIPLVNDEFEMLLTLHDKD